MKKLFLFRGLPASGKSSLVEEQQLGYCVPGAVISADDVRLLFSTPVYGKASYKTAHINGENDKQVWNFIHDRVKQRLIEGQTTIVDATHVNVDSINYYKQFCLENGVECIVVEFNEVTVEKCKARNAKRPDFRRVPNEVIDRMAEKIKVPVPSWCKTITDGEFIQLLNKIESGENKTDFSPIDYNKFDKIVVFGDIHGCYEPLKEYFGRNPLNDRTKYIFCGDYEDRGKQNDQVFAFLLEHRNDSNFLFLKGNHSRHTFAYSKGEDVSSREFRDHTAKQLNGFNKRDLKKFCLKQGAFAYFTFAGKEFLVTHAGVAKMPNSFTNEKDLVFGAGEYGDSKAIDELFVKNHPDIISIHGHRNVDEIPLGDGFKSNVFNLEGKVEYGGHLRILEIENLHTNSYDCGISVLSIKNDVYRVAGCNPEIIEELNNSRFVNAKELPNGITSYSFTKECFFDKRWDNLTTKARGLFCRGDKVVARSYDKFFNIGERESLEEILSKFSYPVRVWRKENGYLGIVSYDDETNDLIVASKSTTESDYAKAFKEYLLKHTDSCGHTIYDKLKRELKGKNQSMVFEVCLKSDPHIVEYPEDKIVLLDVFDNTFEGKCLDGYDLPSVAHSVEVERKHQVVTLLNAQQVKDFIRRQEMQSEELYSETEGFVFEDVKGYRVKYKTLWYRFWKFLRNQCEAGKWADKLPTELNGFELEYKVAGTIDPLDFFTKNLTGHEGFNIIEYRKAIQKKLKENFYDFV